jgi:hypothetical protein
MPALENFKMLIFKTIFLNSWTSRSLAFESFSEDDVEEVSTKDTACGFCSKQYNFGIHRNLENVYSVWKALYGTMRRALVQKSVKDLFGEMAFREELN